MFVLQNDQVMIKK